MKILQFVESALAGVGRHVIDLISGLLDRGCEIHLVYSPLRADDVFLADLKSLTGRPGFNVSELRVRPEFTLGDLQAIRTLRSLLRFAGPFQIVHCHSTKAGLLGRLGLIGCAAKRIYTPHMFLTMQPSRSHLLRVAVARMERILSYSCHGIIVVSHEEHRHAVQLGINSSKLYKVA